MLGFGLLTGSGIKDQGGTVLVYRSAELTRGWQLAGEMCSGKQEDGTGIVWEVRRHACFSDLRPSAQAELVPTHHEWALSPSRGDGMNRACSS